MRSTCSGPSGIYLSTSTVFRSFRSCCFGSTSYHVPAIFSPLAALVGVVATFAEVLYISITWNNTSNLTRQLCFLLVALALMAGIAQFLSLSVRPCCLEPCPPVGCLVTKSCSNLYPCLRVWVWVTKKSLGVTHGSPCSNANTRHSTLDAQC